jgi:hypothetical protein
MVITLNYKGVRVNSFATDPANPNVRHLNAEVVLDIVLKIRTFKDISVPIRQPFGEGSIGGDIEVGSIRETDYNLAWNHNEFVEKTREYFERCIGPKGCLIKTSDSPDFNIHMVNCFLGLKHTATIATTTGM